jgi:glycosyltransferase involved in cell wall biosynthesis
MRLLFLSNLYPPYEIGGYEQWCQEVAERLTARGHRLQVLTSRYGVSKSQPAEPNVIRSLHLQAEVHHYRPAQFFLKRTRQEQWNEHELRRVINEFGPDLVVIWGMWDLSHRLPYCAEQWLPGRVAYYISSYWPNDLDLHREYWRLPAHRKVTESIKKPFRRAALARLDREGYPPRLQFEHAVCCSQYVRTALVQAGKLPAQSGVLLGGIDPAPFLASRAVSGESSDGYTRLLFVGSLLPHKGAHTAIEAMGLLRQRGGIDRVSLTILGGGHPDYEARLRNMVDELGVDGQVHFAGRVPRSEIPKWMPRYDVYLFTSIWAEPMARVVMEAMAAGLAVIGTEVGGQTEMLCSGENALTFEAGNATSLAARIETLVARPELRSSLAQAGQAMVLERFTLDRMVEDMEAWLVGITADRTASIRMRADQV